MVAEWSPWEVQESTAPLWKSLQSTASARLQVWPKLCPGNILTKRCPVLDRCGNKAQSRAALLWKALFSHRVRVLCTLCCHLLGLKSFKSISMIDLGVSRFWHLLFLMIWQLIQLILLPLLLWWTLLFWDSRTWPTWNCHFFQPDTFKFTCSLLSQLIFMCQPDSQGSWHLCSLAASVCDPCSSPCLSVGHWGLSHSNVPMAAAGLLIILTDGNGHSSGSHWGSMRGSQPPLPSVQSPGSQGMDSYLQAYGSRVPLCIWAMQALCRWCVQQAWTDRQSLSTDSARALLYKCPAGICICASVWIVLKLSKGIFPLPHNSSHHRAVLHISRNICT